VRPVLACTLSRGVHSPTPTRTPRASSSEVDRVPSGGLRPRASSAAAGRAAPPRGGPRWPVVRDRPPTQSERPLRGLGFLHPRPPAGGAFLWSSDARCRRRRGGRPPASALWSLRSRRTGASGIGQDRSGQAACPHPPPPVVTRLAPSLSDKACLIRTCPRLATPWAGPRPPAPSLYIRGTSYANLHRASQWALRAPPAPVRPLGTRGLPPGRPPATHPRPASSTSSRCRLIRLRAGRSASRARAPEPSPTPTSSSSSMGPVTLAATSPAHPEGHTPERVSPTLAASCGLGARAPAGSEAGLRSCAPSPRHGACPPPPNVQPASSSSKLYTGSARAPHPPLRLRGKRESTSQRHPSASTGYAPSATIGGS